LWIGLACDTAVGERGFDRAGGTRMTGKTDPLADIRLIVAHAVELSPADMADDVDIMTTFAAGPREISRALAKIEEKFQITIAREDVGERPTIASIYRAVMRQTRSAG
jgi:hypothetical protein